MELPEDLELLPYVCAQSSVCYLMAILLSPFELLPYSNKVQQSDAVCWHQMCYMKALTRVLQSKHFLALLFIVL